ncbi:hypothetical protein GCM10018793_39290 [Streptomyces sulfonofaciens]|uniref:Uncharacterized protein n=1 Tax=Streptomyces sulfonofaciens TaxID=68272 RepID=A0A919GCR6_9ACTN|nr:hypothetical protein [Streptomyces sulfonofaciens]GHH81584.1 hypothetical protein GCM10018793_39290 [Streptomyces sulfonofaciens]
MISINTGFSSAVKLTDRPVAVSCLLGSSIPGTDLTGVPAVRSASSVSLAGLPVRERNERPTQAPEAVAAAQAQAYAFAATGAGARKQTTQHHTMWAFRGLEPWSDPA